MIKELKFQDFEEGVKWKSVMLSSEQNSESENGKKLWKMEVTIPFLQCSKESPTIVIERFAIVNVALMRKGKTNKLEARLLPPIPTLTFSNNGGSSLESESAQTVVEVSPILS